MQKFCCEPTPILRLLTCVILSCPTSIHRVHVLLVLLNCPGINRNLTFAVLLDTPQKADEIGNIAHALSV